MTFREKVGRLQRIVGCDEIDERFGPETCDKTLAYIDHLRGLSPVGIPSVPVRAKTFNEEVRLELTKLWETSKVTAVDDRFEWALRKLTDNQDAYAKVAEAVNSQMPWWFVGVIHVLECSCRFDQHLHNGDSLKAKTVRVPAGRPKTGKAPYNWEESAIDALTMPGKAYHEEGDWSIAATLFRLEGYNGYGYRLYRGIHTPYLWSGTNHYTRGKYTSDGNYSATAVSKQAGAAGLIKLALTA